MNTGLRDYNHQKKIKKPKPIDKSYYDILGVNSNVQLNDLRKNYLQLVKKHHPDRQKSEVNQKGEIIKDITSAYAILSDPEKRREYDRQITVNSSPVRSQKRVRHPLVHLRTTIEVSVQESLIGCTKIIEFNRYCACTNCSPTKRKCREDIKGIKGEGERKEEKETESERVKEKGTETCEICEGSGMILRPHQECIPVPAGVLDGMKATIHGQGDIGPEGEAGDLIVIFKVEPHPQFLRVGNDAVFTVGLPYSSFVFGCSVCVPSLYNGDLLLNLPPLNSPGSVLILSNIGFFDPITQERGDLKLIFLCESLTPEELKLLLLFDGCKSR